MRIYFFFVLTAILASCAMRKNLDTSSPPPVIAGQSNSGTTNDPDLRAATPDYSGCVNSGGSLCAAASTPFCSPDATAKYPGDNQVGTTGLNADGSAWAKGGGCVLRPIREVWAALNNELGMKIGASDSYVMDHPNIQLSSTITNFYQVTYSKNAPIIGSINWTLRWFHGVVDGTFEQPQVVEIIYKRFSGTPFMPVWDGKIILAWLNNSTTA